MYLILSGVLVAQPLTGEGVLSHIAVALTTMSTLALYQLPAHFA